MLELNSPQRRFTNGVQMGTDKRSAGLLEDLDKDPRLLPQQETNYETPLALLDNFLTPNDRFFVRSNGPTAAISLDPDAWRLGMTGLVHQEIDLSLADLKAMPQRALTAFLECSGNSRSRFPADPAKVEGTNWGNGAIGNAEWRGIARIRARPGRNRGRLGRYRCAGGGHARDAAGVANRSCPPPGCAAGVANERRRLASGARGTGSTDSARIRTGGTVPSVLRRNGSSDSI